MHRSLNWGLVSSQIAEIGFENDFVFVYLYISISLLYSTTSNLNVGSFFYGLPWSKLPFLFAFRQMVRVVKQKSYWTEVGGIHFFHTHQEQSILKRPSELNLVQQCRTFPLHMRLTHSRVNLVTLLLRKKDKKESSYVRHNLTTSARYIYGTYQCPAVYHPL